LKKSLRALALTTLALLSLTAGCSSTGHNRFFYASSLPTAVSPDETSPQPAPTPQPSPVIRITTAPDKPTAEATAAAQPTALPLPEFTNPSQEDFQRDASSWDAELLVVDMSNTGLWQYFEEGTLVHPIALEIVDGTAYIVDSGRVLALDLANPAELKQLLSPGDMVENVPVMEPLDLAFGDNQLLVLDRAGDVYAYDNAAGMWRLDRYNRPVEESSGHYFVAVSADRLAEETVANKALLETNYKFGETYGHGQDRIWNLPDARGVDIAFDAGDVYVLQRELHDSLGGVSKYRDTGLITSFRPGIEIDQPRQLYTAKEGIYVLDLSGRRLLLFDRDYGRLIRMLQLPQDQPVSAMAVDSRSGQLILAGKDRIYLVGAPEQRHMYAGAAYSDLRESHDFSELEMLDDFIVPIGGSNISFRDFQLPGAPRHYRLGIHRGLDFYWQPGTKVRAVGDGKVIRVDHDYVSPTAADFNAWWEDSSERGQTSSDVLDKYMGRQVWIEHAPGIVSRYAHLRAVEPGLRPGALVTRDQVLGEVGNSGSPASLESESADAHLHYELWLDDSYLGQFLRPIETREWIERIFPISRD
jgi:Peptidase family M23